MTWGSASADRSIIASTPLPRTPVPPPIWAGTPSLPGQGNRRILLCIARLVPGIGQPTLFGVSRVRFHPGQHPTSSEGGWVPPGCGRRSSSEPRAPSLIGERQPAPFGVLCAVFHWDREPGALRSLGHPISSGQGTWSSSEPRAPQISSEQGKWSSSEPRALGSTPGQENRTSSEDRRSRFEPGQGLSPLG
jgi:hypothetical protein